MSEQDVLRDEVDREHAKVLRVEEQRDGLLDALREVMEQVGGFLPRRLERKAQAAIELGERRT